MELYTPFSVLYSNTYHRAHEQHNVFFSSSDSLVCSMSAKKVTNGNEIDIYWYISCYWFHSIEFLCFLYMFCTRHFSNQKERSKKKAATSTKNCNKKESQKVKERMDRMGWKEERGECRISELQICISILQTNSSLCLVHTCGSNRIHFVTSTRRPCENWQIFFFSLLRAIDFRW